MTVEVAKIESSPGSLAAFADKVFVVGDEYDGSDDLWNDPVPTDFSIKRTAERRRT
jgi:hypothetical protein